MFQHSALITINIALPLPCTSSPPLTCTPVVPLCLFHSSVPTILSHNNCIYLFLIFCHTKLSTWTCVVHLLLPPLPLLRSCVTPKTGAFFSLFQSNIYDMMAAMDCKQDPFFIILYCNRIFKHECWIWGHQAAGSRHSGGGGGFMGKRGIRDCIISNPLDTFHDYKYAFQAPCAVSLFLFYLFIYFCVTRSHTDDPHPLTMHQIYVSILQIIETNNMSLHSVVNGEARKTQPACHSSQSCPPTLLSNLHTERN